MQLLGITVSARSSRRRCNSRNASCRSPAAAESPRSVNREERDQDAEQHALGRAEEAAELPIEFLELDPLDHLRNQVEADPDDQPRAQEQNQHRQEDVPGRRALITPASGCRNSARRSSSGRSRASEAICHARPFHAPQHDGAREDDQHEDVVGLHP